MSDKNSIVAVYETHTDAEAGVQELQKAIFDITTLSVVGKEYCSQEDLGRDYNSRDRVKYLGKMEPFGKDSGAFLRGLALFVLPGIGRVLIAGPMASAVAAVLEGAIVTDGLSALGVGFFSLGIPKNCILRYETSLMADKFLLVAHGTAEEMMKAKDILRNARPEELNLHFADETVLVHA
jgi:hypothetical protein